MNTTYTTTSNFGTEWYSWGMKKGWVLALLVIIIIGLVLLVVLPAPAANAPANSSATTTPVATQASLGDLIVVTSPLPNAIISSTTITITGKARGNWFFEASFPIEVFGDPAEGLLGNGIAQAQSDWMTTDFVPFTATVKLHPTIQTPGETLHIILMNDNPSGDPAKQKRLDLPVQFSENYKI
jgi:hypothetical protein